MQDMRRPLLVPAPPRVPERVFLVSSMAHLGGTEVATSMQAKLLQRAGAEVTVIGRAGPLSADLTAQGITCVDLDTHAARGMGQLRSLWQLVRLLRRHRPEIIHAQMARPVPLLWAAIRLAGLSPKRHRLFWTSRGMAGASYPKVARLFRRLDVRALGNCRTEAAKLIRHGMTAARTSYLYNPHRLTVGAVRPRPPEPPLVIGVLSALRPDRRIDHAIDLAEQLAEQMPDFPWVLQIAGDGPDRPRLEAMVLARSLDSRITFLGPVRDVAGFLSGLHLMVSTFFPDDPDSGAGLSNAIIEAMVVGVPVVSYRALGIPEILRHDQTGLLVEPGDQEGLAEAVMSLIRAPQRAERLAETAHRQILPLCDPDLILTRLLQLYEEL